MKTSNQYSILILLIVFLLQTACKSGKQSELGEKDHEILPDDIVEIRLDQAKLAGIETGTIELRSLSGLLKVSGIVTVSPQNIASVCMPMGGFVKSIACTPGSRVKKGQVLAILENQDFIDLQQNYLEAHNNLEYASADLKRHSSLYKEDVYSEQNVQQVTNDFKNLKAKVKALEQKLLLLGINLASLSEDNISGAVELVSPIDGNIKAVNVTLGKYVSPSDIIVEVINSSDLMLELTLFEKEADKVFPGQDIRFFINNEEEQHDAIIQQTGKLIQGDKSYKVYAKINGTCKNLLPGMYVNALIQSSGKQVTSLPSNAIVSFDDKDYIFIFEKEKTENGKAFTEYKMVEVTKGVTEGEYSEVRLPEGLDIQSIKVVVKGAYNLLSAKKNAGEMSC